MTMPDKVFLRTQEGSFGVYEGTKSDFKYLKSTPVREAAPELLEALEGLLENDFIFKGEDIGDFHIRKSNAKCKARAAIAKARGKS